MRGRQHLEGIIMAIQKRSLPVAGMHCDGCEAKIQSGLSVLAGVKRVRADHVQQRVEVEFDDSQVRTSQILACIEDQGYQYADLLPPTERAWPSPGKVLTFLGLLVLVGGVVMYGKRLMPGVMGQFSPATGYGVLFSVGLITGLHCIGMCGGFIVRYSSGIMGRWAQFKAHVMYALGKNASYAMIGALMGTLGSLIVVTPVLRGSVSLASGLFLILFGLNMLGLLPSFRLGGKAQAAATHKVYQDLKPRSNPLAIGFFSGFLIGCGPLQAMYIAALV
jgi:copper chaperone CopZ